MSAPSNIIQLVDSFHQQIEVYRAGGLNETQTRIQFIDPFFEALGWDVRNQKQATNIYQEVIHEDSLKISDANKAKAPDYSFRIGGIRKFFVEAKKPAVNVGQNISAAFQVRRYGWSAKLILSILTDFEEFSVYDCRIMPNKNDPAVTSRVKYFHYTEYIEKWEEIYNLFSKEAVLNGALEKFAESQIKGEITVDQAFLQEIEIWRENLAANIVWRNSQIKPRELNFAVQMTINRIIFLRICEDRGIEPYQQLYTLLKFENIYQELGRLFINADYRYNSGLFHFQNEKGREQPDDFTLNLQIDDSILKSILKKLYPPESPYEFSVIPVEILGQVYEQFLGKVIKISPSRQAVIEDKPEVRKAGGVYYTPSYIVDYIIKETIGKILSGKKPEKIQEITILDPACGSGSFLIVAYQFVLDWYLQQYLQNPKKYKDKFYQISSTNWRLTSQERKRILLTHIYGVDIDQQAVETTKLSLLLKVLEGESGETITTQLQLLKERALPDLDHNIFCGNSLIDGEFYNKNQMNLLDEDTAYRVNVFDWEESFPQIMKRGGFDIIIGNPPYIRIQALKEWANLEVEFYKQNYITASKGNYDIYVVFVEQGLKFLKKDGSLGFILPHKFFNAQYGVSLRKMISQGQHLEKIVYFGDQQVFSGATTYTCLLFLKNAQQANLTLEKVVNLADWKNTVNGYNTSNNNSNTCQFGTIDNSSISELAWNFTLGKEADLFTKLQQINCQLEDVTARIFQGLKTGSDRIYIVQELARENNLIQVYAKETQKTYWLESDLLHLLIKGGDSKKYHLSTTNRLIIFPYRLNNGIIDLIPIQILSQQYPLTWNYLLENQNYLQSRERGKMLGENWYGYTRNQALDVISLPKIFTPDIATTSSFSYDQEGDIFFTGGVAGGYGILVKSGYAWQYILGLLNSKVLEFYLKKTATVMRGGYYSFESRFIRHLPIKLVDNSQPKSQDLHDLIVKLVEQMLTLDQRLNQAQTPPQQKMIKQQIKATDRQINQLVYQLYELTDAEIDIVDNS
ncbi:Eco57I restriction-modification methylase domain-containing protein [Cuspidothrix issatschenkoi LEGE 03284]|uniref:Eco57I restriction-modification methylase domain-containing protein n=1 Tax=Cuspidothrix issatschenkoi TaxID=230752 RepID=UPI00187EEF7A|nr:N-6 DNA methylase [Cuspidothrix issatschenkoi]MBE9231424.1 Eco57I restriction-modification methylase domain-containing protein [Cuspidothrix issatschenkoi LEGE 03284]